MVFFGYFMPVHRLSILEYQNQRRSAGFFHW